MSFKLFRDYFVSNIVSLYSPDPVCRQSACWWGTLLSNTYNTSGSTQELQGWPFEIYINIIILVIGQDCSLVLDKLYANHNNLVIWIIHQPCFLRLNNHSRYCVIRNQSQTLWVPILQFTRTWKWEELVRMCGGRVLFSALAWGGIICCGQGACSGACAQARA